MADAVTGKRLEEILAEQGLSTGFVYGAPQDESWDGVVDREIKLEPKARTKWLMDSLFYQSFSTANTEFPYWYTRKFEECDGDVLEVRRAKGAGLRLCAYDAHCLPKGPASGREDQLSARRISNALADQLLLFGQRG